VPWEEAKTKLPRGESKVGSIPRKVTPTEFPSLNVSAQSAKFGCKRTVENLYSPVFRGGFNYAPSTLS
jgi:hypothetical protein